MLSPDLAARLDRFIDLYGVHEPGVLPVSVYHLAAQRGFRIVYRDDMGPVYGCAMVTGTTREIYLNACVRRPWQRFAAAHELGHIIAEHPSAGTGYRACSTLTLNPADRAVEREASIIGGLLLVPRWAIVEYETADAIAAACDVPREIVGLLLGELRAQEHAA